MKKQIIMSFFKQKLQQYNVPILVTVLTLGLLTACDLNLPDDIFKSGPLTLSASKTSLVLNQKDVNNAAVDLTWTTGTNHGTGSSISYNLQVDKKGNGFSKAISLDMGKGIYINSFNVGALNDSLLTRWGVTAGSASDLEARVIATVYSDPVVKDTSNILTISVATYKPVSKTLYLYGSASPKGTDLNNALQLTAQSDPTVFVYQGALGVGNLKFITTQGQILPSYNKGSSDSQLILRTDAGDADNLFSITEAAVYKVTVSLLDLSVSIIKSDLPPYSTIYMIGDAAPNGWDVTKATQLVQNSTNPFIFTYQGVMLAGSFKFPVNRNADFGQDMYERTDDTHAYLHHGGAADDNKWTIAKKGYYTITLNLLDNSISIYREKLYIVGDATPIGWTITSAIQMTEDANDGCIFTYNGPMLVGGFKFPVNQDSDWGQDMYMRTDDTHMYRHIGGQADDNKWSITTAGNYVITANIETLALSYVKQ
jgi:hypothetical protein